MRNSEQLKRGYEDTWKTASAVEKAGMMRMLLELRAGLERKLERYTLPSAERDEIVVGFADVEAMILQAGGDPALRVN